MHLKFTRLSMGLIIDKLKQILASFHHASKGRIDVTKWESSIARAVFLGGGVKHLTGYMQSS
jgi:hypothetical protein